MFTFQLIFKRHLWLALGLLLLFPASTNAQRAPVQVAAPVTNSASLFANKIAFLRPEADTGSIANVWVMNPDGTGETQVTNLASDARDVALAPDGSELLFSSQNGGSIWKIWRISAPMETPVALPLSSHALHPAWSQDGTQIAFSGDLQGYWWEIWVANADGSNLRRVSNDIYAVGQEAWAPDGQRLAYVSNPRAGYFELYTATVTGTQRTLITSAWSGSSDMHPAWSPDGTKMATVRFETNTQGPYDLWLMNPDGSQGQVLVTNIDKETRIAWTRDSQWLVFGKGGQVWRVKRDGSGLTPMTQNGGWWPGTNLLSFSPLNYVYLPMSGHGYNCPDFADDFSNPASGWAFTNTAAVQTDYMQGEYRVLNKQPGNGVLLAAPTCPQVNYVVNVDARWEGTPGSSYDVPFGITSGFARFYLFRINPDANQYALYRYGPGGWAVLVEPTVSNAIYTGIQTNQLQVIRAGKQMTLSVNGTMLGGWTDNTITGLTNAGVAAWAYSNVANADARFDNFTMQAWPLGSNPARAANTAPSATPMLWLPDIFSSRAMGAWQIAPP